MRQHSLQQQAERKLLGSFLGGCLLSSVVLYLFFPSFLGLAQRWPGWGEGEQAAGAWENGEPLAVDSVSTQYTCWASGDHGGYGEPQAGATSAGMLSGPLGRSSQAGPPSAGVVVQGQGCRVCVAGATCTFTIAVRPPAQWVADAPARRWEIMAIFRGPALAIGRVEQLPPLDGSAFLVSYQIWDPGHYAVRLHSGCGTLNYTGNFTSLKGHMFAAWNTTVLPPSGRARPGLVAEATAAGPPPLDPRPCSDSASLQARWFRISTGEYRWEPFPCTASTFFGDWVPALNAAGIKEISFIGDSHQRALMHHLYYMLAREVDWPNHQTHGDVSYVVNHTSGATLRLNLFFIRGIYVAGEEFGCQMSERTDRNPRRPNLSPTADVNVVEAGYWTGTFCSEPEMAFASTLPSFMLWLRGEVAKAEKPPLVVYRTTPPRPTDVWSCQPLSNVYIQYANRLAQGIVPLVQGLFFDSWQIEAPRYLEHCPNEHHYSCVREKYVWGPIGEADTIALIHFLIREKSRSNL